jgi:hypothetical protein
MSKDEAGRVWLLPHPGGERRPKRGQILCHWPEGNTHARKFLQVDGVALSSEGKSVRGKMVVWTEYEAPTYAQRLARGGGGPEFVHTPSSPVLHPEMKTDPWIFQPGFVWSICRQPNPWRSPARPGDLVLFGSSVASSHGAKNWVLDTVMVVKERLSGSRCPGLKESFQELVEPTLNGLDVKPFLGRQYRPDIAFSFAPCLPVSGKVTSFERPSINALLGELTLINSGKPPSPGHATTLAACRAEGGAEAFWKRLAGFVHERGLLLGLRFDLPAISVLNPPAAPAAPTPESSRSARRKRRHAA